MTIVLIYYISNIKCGIRREVIFKLVDIEKVLWNIKIYFKGTLKGPLIWLNITMTWFKIWFYFLDKFDLLLASRRELFCVSGKRLRVKCLKSMSELNSVEKETQEYLKQWKIETAKVTSIVSATTHCSNTGPEGSQHWSRR